MCDKKTKLCYQVDNAIQVYQAVLRIQVELTQIRIQPLRKTGSDHRKETRFRIRPNLGIIKLIFFYRVHGETLRVGDRSDWWS